MRAPTAPQRAPCGPFSAVRPVNPCKVRMWPRSRGARPCLLPDAGAGRAKPLPAQSVVRPSRGAIPRVSLAGPPSPRALCAALLIGRPPCGAAALCSGSSALAMCKSLALAAAGRRVLFLCHRQAAAQMQVRWPEDAAGAEGAAMQRVAIKCVRARPGFRQRPLRAPTGRSVGIWTVRRLWRALQRTYISPSRRLTRWWSTTPPRLPNGPPPSPAHAAPFPRALAHTAAPPRGRDPAAARLVGRALASLAAFVEGHGPLVVAVHLDYRDLAARRRSCPAPARLPPRVGPAAGDLDPAAAHSLLFGLLHRLGCTPLVVDGACTPVQPQPPA